MNCLVCKQDSHRHACDPCITQTRRWLRELELYTTWLHMPMMLTPARGETGRRHPGYKSRSPARDEVIIMLDRRSRTTPTPIDEDRGVGLDDDENPVWSILGSLHGIATFVRQTADQSSPRRVMLAGEIGYLLAHLDWAANHPWVDGIIADIRNLHAQARNRVHDTPPRPIGNCPHLLDTGECGTPLFVPLHGDEVRCSNKDCRRTWTRAEWLGLAMLLTNTNPRSERAPASA